MDGATEELRRIADALARLAGSASGPQTDWMASPAYVWDGAAALGVAAIEAPTLALLKGIDQQKSSVTRNVERLSHGHAAHDMLLWGARGMGKSALIRSAVREAQAARPGSIALVQVSPDAVEHLPALFRQLRTAERNFLFFIDDLGFAEGDAASPRQIRSWLEGGVDARPDNVRLAVTSNHRAIVPRSSSEQNDPLNPRDAVDDTLALADRFGLSLGFHNCTQDVYLDIVGGYADRFGLAWDRAEALEWSKRRGTRSGRTAWQFITELAGRAGIQLTR
ncbi:ATP-binding protein [Pontixanthobacter luteolus]|nr:ATP-binding protein [Pontixanthobacter luteolus]